MSNIEIIDGAPIDWNRFKYTGSNSALSRVELAYIELCKLVHDINGKIVSDYISATDNIIISIDDINIYTTPFEFKRTRYKSIVKFFNLIKNENDRFIKFSRLSGRNILMALIELELGETIEISISQYEGFISTRRDIKEKLKNINGRIISDYTGNKNEMKIMIDEVKLNILPYDFTKNKHDRILDFKKSILSNGDRFIKFSATSNNKDILIANIITFDGGEIEIDMVSYYSFNNSRKEFYKLVEHRNDTVLSHYTKENDKILIKFNCKHAPSLIRVGAYKQGQGCPYCKNKGEGALHNLLVDIGYEVETQKTFNGLKYKQKLKYDFYLPQYNLLIELDGDHHRNLVTYGGDIEGAIRKFEDRKHKDNLKDNYAKENNIHLLRIEYNNGKIELDKWKELILNKISEIESSEAA